MSRVAELVAQLQLRPHPEGGHYAERFRSTRTVRPDDDRGARTGLTMIYFLLEAGQVSRWHRVRSDESWHWYEGAPLELLTASPDGGAVTRTLLGPLSAGAEPQAMVPADHWQAARPTGAYALVGCTVGPGFDFADFTMRADLPVTADAPLRLSATG